VKSVEWAYTQNLLLLVCCSSIVQRKMQQQKETGQKCGISNILYRAGAFRPLQADRVNSMLLLIPEKLSAYVSKSAPWQAIKLFLSCSFQTQATATSTSREDVCRVCNGWHCEASGGQRSPLPHSNHEPGRLQDETQGKLVSV